MFKVGWRLGSRSWSGTCLKIEIGSNLLFKVVLVLMMMNLHPRYFLFNFDRDNSIYIKGFGIIKLKIVVGWIGDFSRLFVFLLVIWGLLVFLLDGWCGHGGIGIDFASNTQILSAEGQRRGRVGGGIATKKTEIHVWATCSSTTSCTKWAQKVAVAIHATAACGSGYGTSVG